MSTSVSQFITAKIILIAQERVVLDVGGGGPLSKWLAEFRYLFTNCKYQTLDPDITTNPSIVGSIYAIPLPDNSVDGIICSSVLEHVEDPIRAATELYRVLRGGGKTLFIRTFNLSVPCSSRPLWRLLAIFRRYITLTL